MTTFENTQEAKAFLTKVLPFAAANEDYATLRDGVAISDIEELQKLLMNDFGKYTVDALCPDTKQIAVVYVYSTPTGVEYQTPTPVEFSCKIMQALYILAG